MRYISTSLLFVLVSGLVLGQQQSRTLDLHELVGEALRNNAGIQASLHQVDVVHARVGQAGTLDDPELTYMREEMPGFRWNEAAMQKFELMQMIRFPSKSAKQSELAEIQAEHSHHDHYEKELEVIAKLKAAYYELWFVQQSRVQNQENARLLQQFVSIARTKFGVGDAALQDVLKANVEFARLGNQGTVLQQQEQSAKAMLIAILNRQPDDTLGSALLADSIAIVPTLETLLHLASKSRPMLLHDSLAIEESRAMLSLSRREYLPDLKLGVQYVTAPMGDFRGWSIIAGLSLPFAPWTLSKANSRVDEATAVISKSSATLNESRNMVFSSVRDLYFKVQSAKRQTESYSGVILPQARQSLKASTTAYQNGRTDFLMLIDAYRTLVELSMESLMVRMQFEQAMAELERQVGVPDFVSK